MQATTHTPQPQPTRVPVLVVDTEIHALVLVASDADGRQVVFGLATVTRRISVELR